MLINWLLHLLNCSAVPSPSTWNSSFWRFFSYDVWEIEYFVLDVGHVTITKEWIEGFSSPNNKNNERLNLLLCHLTFKDIFHFTWKAKGDAEITLHED